MRKSVKFLSETFTQGHHAAAAALATAHRGAARLHLTVINELPTSLVLRRDITQPLPPWRRRVVLLGSQATRVILPLLGFWVRVRGWDNVEEGRQLHAVVLFNHVSFVSAPATPLHVSS